MYIGSRVPVQEGTMTRAPHTCRGTTRAQVPTMRFFHHREFSSRPHLLAAKKQQGATVSLVIPALNEAATVGAIVEAACRESAGADALLDEVIVMDGSSEDGTERVAAGAGARVCRACDVMPDMRVPEGKGASMWKSQFVARGDIIVFLDADIGDFGPHYLYGLIGPLLLDPELQWVKAFYRRPLVLDRTVHDGYGGRVTELLVRPLLSAWYPELATVRQPLAGECAFRRGVLRQLPFSSGYGVETQLLLHMYRRHGLSGLAQVDLDSRRHRNRPVAQLALMSFAILRVFFEFLREDKEVSLPPLSDELVRAACGAEERVRVSECMLPPAETVQAVV